METPYQGASDTRYIGVQSSRNKNVSTQRAKDKPELCVSFPAALGDCKRVLEKPSAAKSIPHIRQVKEKTYACIGVLLQSSFQFKGCV